MPNNWIWMLSLNCGNRTISPTLAIASFHSRFGVLLWFSWFQFFIFIFQSDCFEFPFFHHFSIFEFLFLLWFFSSTLFRLFNVRFAQCVCGSFLFLLYIISACTFIFHCFSLSLSPYLTVLRPTDIHTKAFTFYIHCCRSTLYQMKCIIQKA